MKKVINGKVYDTDTAQAIGAWDNGQYDFNRCDETLYRKRTGEFFIYGSGGPMSKYARSEGDNHWTTGAQIIPLSYDAAQKWAEDHLSADEYEAIFGNVEDDGSKTTVLLSMTSSVATEAKRAAVQQGISLSAYVESLILRDRKGGAAK